MNPGIWPTPDGPPHDIGLRHDPDDALILLDEDAPDLPFAHQLGGLQDARRVRYTHQVSFH